MPYMFRATMLAVLPALFLSLAPTAQASDDSQLAKFEQFAEAPVDQFTYYNLTGYQSLDDLTLAVWTGVSEVYLIKLMPPCPDFNFASAIGLDGSQAHVFSARFDTVTVGNHVCNVESIRPVDYKAMQKAEEAAESD